MPSSTMEVSVASQEGDKRQRQDGPMADPVRPATGGHGVHLQEKAGKSPLARGHSPCAANNLSRAPPTSHWRNVCVCSGDLLLGSEVPEALRKIARRILPYTDGKFSPTTGDPVVKVLTDDLLMAAAAAVKDVCGAVEPTPSGKAQFRLLAWVVADAVGALEPVEKDVAETVGKRLQRQASRVSTSIAAVAASFEKERDTARSAVEKGVTLAEDLEGLLADIDANEQDFIRPLQQEIYVGFVELGPTESALAIGPESPEPESPPPGGWLAAERREDPVWQRWREEGGAVPHAIARRLGDEGCRLLARELSLFPKAPGEEILTIHIPSILKHVLENVLPEAEREARDTVVRARQDLALEQEACAIEIREADARQATAEARAMAQLDEAEAREEEAWREWELMHVELAEAKAQVTALHDVISRNFKNS